MRYTFTYMSAESWLPWDWSGAIPLRDDNRDIIMICGTDPHAYKGIEELTWASVDPTHDHQGGVEGHG